MCDLDCFPKIRSHIINCTCNTRYQEEESVLLSHIHVEECTLKFWRCTLWPKSSHKSTTTHPYLWSSELLYWTIVILLETLTAQVKNLMLNVQAKMLNAQVHPIANACIQSTIMLSKWHHKEKWANSEVLRQNFTTGLSTGAYESKTLSPLYML